MADTSSNIDTENTEPEKKYDNPANLPEIAFPELTLPSPWTFWEHTKSMTGQKQTSSNWGDFMQPTACFNDAISFWQLWNRMPYKQLLNFFYDPTLQQVKM
jgi:hypothetical protein